MAQKYLRDAQGRVIGSLMIEGNGNVRLHRANGTVAGTWIKGNNTVLNSRLQVIGRGVELLVTLLN